MYDKLISLFASIRGDSCKSFHSKDELPQNIQKIPSSNPFREVDSSHVETMIPSLKNKACHLFSYQAEALQCMRHIISPIFSLLVNSSLNLVYFQTPSKLKD